jgi:hypothetical protein
VFWRAVLRSLKERELAGVQLAISDQHAGLVAALGRVFQGVGHQRCRVHFARNLLALVPKSHKDMVAAVFRTIFAQPTPEAVSRTWDTVRDQLAAGFPKIGPLMDHGKAEVLAFAAFPRPHWVKVWSTNPLERVNKEIKRRARVVGIFPNEAAVIRLVGAVLADMHDEWQVSDRRYLSEGSMARLSPTTDNEELPPSRPAPDIENALETPPLSGAQPALGLNPRRAQRQGLVWFPAAGWSWWCALRSRSSLAIRRTSLVVEGVPRLFGSLGVMVANTDNPPGIGRLARFTYTCDSWRRNLGLTGWCSSKIGGSGGRTVPVQPRRGPAP